MLNWLEDTATASHMEPEELNNNQINLQLEQLLDTTENNDSIESVIVETDIPEKEILEYYTDINWTERNSYSEIFWNIFDVAKIFSIKVLKYFQWKS